MWKWNFSIIFVIFIMLSNPNCIRNSDVFYDMVVVDAGSFIMGNNNGEEIEKPEHLVILTRSFYMGKYEVTYDLYDKFCSDVGLLKLPDNGWGRGLRPVILGNFYHILKFCNWLSIRQNLTPAYIFFSKYSIKWDQRANGYRLPTEAEWEFASRGGNFNKKYKFSGSDDYLKVAWCSENSGNQTHPVGGKKPNELGIYDMSGNLWEWCWDHIDYEYYKHSPIKDPIFKNSKKLGRFRAKRGGSYNSSSVGLVSSHRNFVEAHPSNNAVGLRLVRNVK